MSRDESATAAGLRTLTLSDLAAFSFPDVPEIVDGLLPAGALVLVVGRPKAGKSLLFGIDLCAAIALGETFIDRATTQGPAIYVPAEDSLRLVRERLWTRIGREREAPLHVLPVDGSLPQSLRIDDPVSVAQLLATVEAISPRVLVLDPFRELHHRKENDADDMAAILRPLRQIAHETETTVVLIHHRNKHAQDVSHASRGSSAIAGGVDVVITLDVASEGTGDTDELNPDQKLMMLVEGRYGPRQRLGARLGAGLIWHPASPTINVEMNAAERVLRALEMGAAAMTPDELANATGLARKTVQNALTAHYSAGRVSRAGAGTKADPFNYSRHPSSAGRDESGTNNSASTRQNEPIRPDPEGYTYQAGTNPHPNGHRPEPPPRQNACEDCGKPCGGAKLCSPCATEAVPGSDGRLLWSEQEASRDRRASECHQA
jgi:KaiC/GvpD/RAD55 family RecA-like ATPase